MSFTDHLKGLSSIYMVKEEGGHTFVHWRCIDCGVAYSTLLASPGPLNLLTCPYTPESPIRMVDDLPDA